MSYKNGNITRLYLKHFLTYNEIEVLPGSHLNIVFGPNGAGKSSLLSAICLVLGSKAELTGRGKDVIEYIKHGEEKAIIEIELFCKPPNRNIIIKRKISKNGKTTYYFQGKETSQKDVLEKVKKLNICIDNLCQFLPQDRVSEFSKLNKIQLLHCTQRAIGEAKLADEHQLLCEQGKNIYEINEQIVNLQKQLDVERAQNNQLVDQVEAINLEKKLEAKIKKLKGLKLLKQYLVGRQELKGELEPLIKELANKIENLTKSVKPLQKKEENIEKKIMINQNLIRDLQAKVVSLERDGRRIDDKFMQEQTNIENEESDFQAYQNICNNRRNEINDLKHTIQVMEGHLQQMADVDEEMLKNEIRNITRKISPLSEQASEYKNKVNEITYSLVAENNQRNRLELSIKALQDNKSRKLKLLLETTKYHQKVKYKAVYEMAKWLEANADNFKGPIHGPMYTIIDVKKGEYAKYVENTVSKNDLIAFICECKDDVNMLKKFADRNRWPINILHSDPSLANQYKPRYPIQNLRNIGFETYLKDVISAPTAVITYLCSIYNIQNIPLATEADFDAVPNDVRCFYIGNDRYDKTVSKYDGASSISIDQLFQIDLMRVNANELDLTNKRNELQTSIESIQNMQLRRQELSEREQFVEKELEKLRNEKYNHQNKLQQKLTLVTKIAERRRQLARREEEEIDIPGAELKMKNKIKKFVSQILELVDKDVSIREELSELTIEFFNNFLIMKTTRSEKEELKVALDNMKSQIAEIQGNYDIQMQRQLDHKQNLRIIYNNLCQHLGCTSRDLKTPDSNVISELEKDYEERTLEEIEQLLADAQARKECIVSPMADVIETFNKRETLINKLQRDISSKTEIKETSEGNLDNARSTWLPKMEELTDEICQHFSSFMKRLGCAGEVSLDKGANENDFSKYGLSIKVRFRDSEMLQELTAHQQSGGERSIITALYLMALQTLKNVPFRCVDEINQGMDAINERRMFEMLVETSTAQDSSQYFFLTPKLLSNLPSNPKVKYLNIINGRKVPPYKKIRAKSMLESLRRMK